MAEIHTTKIYDLFRDIPINRDVDPIRLDSIIKSIQTLDLTRVKPIIVGPDSEIVDGQGRFQACKALGLPIYYTYLPEGVDPIEAMRALNTVSYTHLTLPTKA